MAASHNSSSPVISQSPAQQNQLLPTPSPFSVASTRWSSRPSIHISSLFLRSLALLLSFVSALSLAAPSPKKSKGKSVISFIDYSELLYSFIVSVLVFLYSALQVFKGISDISHRGILISDMASDYISFILDQLGSYLLVSSAAITVTVMQEIRQSAPLWKEVVVDVTMSFACFVVVAVCSVFSGYKLCKRIIW